MRNFLLTMRASWLLVVLIVLAAIVVLKNEGDQRDYTSVVLQQDGTATISAAPVYRDETEKAARTRLLASIDCTTYEVLDEGIYNDPFSKSTTGESHYVYVRYRCGDRHIALSGR